MLATLATIFRGRAARAGGTVETEKFNPYSGAKIREAEAVLSWLINTDDPVSETEALGDLEGDLAGDTAIEKMADADFGNATKPGAQDILKRIKADLEQAAADPGPQTP